MAKLQSPIRIAITGAAGNIGYSLIFRIAAGHVFGDRPVILQLIDRERVCKPLQALLMELQDCAYPALKDCFATADLRQGFCDAEVAILVGAKPRAAGMERKDLLQVNGESFKIQGAALNDVASRDVKVVVVGNPANTNTLIALSSAPGLDPRQFSCLTRLDHNRAVAMLARKLGKPVSAVKGMIVWGNHSITQFPDLLHCTVDGRTVKVGHSWFGNEFIPSVQNRGAEVIEMRGLSSAGSAASAIVDHIQSWVNGTPQDDWVSMGVLSDGSYGVPSGLVFSYPVTIDRDGWNIVPGLRLSEFEKSLIARTVDELQYEREAVSHLLSKPPSRSRRGVI